jgi:NAD+ synthase (glutamine-hydrolysing)
MKNHLRVAFAQINPVVGDLSGNAQLIVRSIEDARHKNCHVVLFPEMCLTGYPPEDLLFKSSFIKENKAQLKSIAKHTKGMVAVVGFVDSDNFNLFNSAAWLENGKTIGVYNKRCLPNYGVFDEIRYFKPGQKSFTRTFQGFKLGLTICEDIWIPGKHWESLRQKHLDAIINISASPYNINKLKHRKITFRNITSQVKSSLFYCNLVGGQDELVFDGASFVLDQHGKTRVQCPSFQEGVFIADFYKNKRQYLFQSDQQKPPLVKIEEIYQALILGIRDYVRKNNFKKIALGLSGGIDSALVAALAVKALGPDRVVCLSMPTRFNKSETKNDAKTIAANLQVEFHEIPIQNLLEAYLKTLGDFFKGIPSGLAEENIQARIRGTLLMAFSNKFGWLILTTGNKSELSTGYCTLYGDTAGGFSVLKDVLKTTVYELCDYINRQAGYDLIPRTIITRPPTAELRDNQKDEDSLGRYSDLDPLIVGYVENNLPYTTLTKNNPVDKSYIRRILSLIDRNEYKRRQAPLGIKITSRSFGKDHRMPITNKYSPAD